MESPKGKCTHHSDCEFEIYKDDLCILHCKKTGFEKEEEISLFNKRLADYAATYLKEKSGGAISKEDTIFFLQGNLYNKVFEEYTLEIKDINFPCIYMSNLSIKNIYNKEFIKCNFISTLVFNDICFNYNLFNEHYIECEFLSLYIENIDFKLLYNNRKSMIEEIFYNKKNMIDYEHLNKSGRLSYEEEKHRKEKENELNKLYGLRFSSCNIKDKILLKNIYSYNHYLSFDNVYSGSIVFDGIFYDCELIINNKKINRIGNNANIISNKISIIKSTFDKEVDFSNSLFSLFKCINSKFNNEVVFKSSIFESNDGSPLVISENKFYKITDFSYTNFNSELIFKENLFYDEVNFLGVSIKDTFSHYETFSFIKHKLDSIGNHIEADKMFAKEMRSYGRSLRLHNSENFFKKLLYFINFIISNFGQSYIMPLVWIISSLFLYSVINFDISHKDLNFLQSLGYFIQNIFSIDLWNYIVKNFSYFNFKLKPGMEFISLLFYIFWGICTWHLIVAVKRHTKR